MLECESVRVLKSLILKELNIGRVEDWKGVGLKGCRIERV